MHVIRASCVYIDSVKGKNRPHRREEASSRPKVTSEAMYVYIYIHKYIAGACMLPKRPNAFHFLSCLQVCSQDDLVMVAPVVSGTRVANGAFCADDIYKRKVIQ